MPPGTCQGVDPLVPRRTKVLPAYPHLSLAATPLPSFQESGRQRTVGPSSGGVGHSLIHPGLLQTREEATVSRSGTR